MRHIWILLLLAPTVSAQGFQFASWSGDLDTTPVEAAGATGPSCTPSTLETLGPDTFRFAETETENGCASAHVTVSLPGAAASVEVSFDVDRQVSGTPLGPRAMHQDLAFLVDGEETSRPVFDPASGSQPSQRVGFRFDVPAGARDAEVVWRFEDRGLLGPLGSEAFSSTASDLQIRIERVPLDAVETEGGRYLEGEEILIVHDVTLDVPAGADDVMVVLDGREPQGVVQPDGSFVPIGLLELEREGERLQVHIPAEVLTGPGTYTLQSTSTIAAPPAPSFVGGIHPAIWPLLATPVLLGSVSMAGAVRFYRQAPKERRSDAVRLLVQNSVVAAGYGILLGTAYLARESLGQNPPGRSAFLLMAQLAVVSFAFLALWQLGARSMTNRLQADLKRKAAEQAHLERLNAELRRSNRDLARFAHIASHDLKEPLRSVQFHSERVMHKYGDRIDDRGRKSLELAAGGAARMRSLVDGLLSYATLESELGPPKAVSLDDAVDEVISGLESLIHERRAHVEHKPLPVVQGHRQLLQQALQNLIVNAVKYAGPDCHVEVRALRRGEHWRIEVEDDGPGIPPEYHEKVFEAFQRLEGRTEEGGTGIGLAVVQRVAQLHGGRVGLQSEPGHGCIFYVELPDKERRAHGDSAGGR